jgi:hypothetical protein
MPTNDLIRPVAFPRGIADAEGRACVRDRASRLVAIDLENGRVLWRTSEPLRPLLIAHDEVIALRETTPSACVALPLDGGSAGTPQWVSDALPLPAWAFTEGAQLEIAAEMRGMTIELHWRARARYRGGAAPSRAILEQAARDAEGTLAVDRSSGKVTPVSDSAGNVPAADFLEEQRIGARSYRLVAENARTALRAADAGSGALLWEAILDEGPSRGPRALRQ